MNYYIYAEEEEKSFKMTYGNKAAEFPAAEFPGIFKKIVEKGSRIYFWDVDLFLNDLLIFFKDLGYKCFPPDAKIKEMPTKSIRPIITGDFELIKMDIKAPKKKSTKIYNADRITKEHSVELLREIQQYGSEKKPQCTMPSICRYRWERWGKNTPYNLQPLIPDAKKMELNDGENVEKYCRKAYRGGFLFDNSGFRGEQKKDVYVYDYNAMYTYIMRNMPMPVGIPTEGKGKPTKLIEEMTKKGKNYYYIHVRTKLRLKKGGLACVRLNYDDPQRYYRQRGYLTTSERFSYKTGYGKDEKIDLYCTCTEWEMIKENYRLIETDYISYIWFVTSTELFKSYNDYFYKMKTDEETPIKKQTGKNFNNFISGNMAKKVVYENAVIDFDHEEFNPFTGENCSKYKITYQETEGGKSTIYIGAAITAYGRKMITDLVKKNREGWLYSDTDSLQKKGEGIKGVKVDSQELGAMKLEHHFDEVYYYSKKRYLGIEHDTQKIDGAFSGICEKDRAELFEILQKCYDNRNKNVMCLIETVDGETDEDFKWYDFLSKNYLTKKYLRREGDFAFFDRIKMMENLQHEKIITSERYIENWEIKRKTIFETVSELTYSFL